MIEDGTVPKRLINQVKQFIHSVKTQEINIADLRHSSARKQYGDEFISLLNKANHQQYLKYYELACNKFKTNF
ncbi:hypothetical protein OQ477_06325 [Bacillus sp. ChL18]|uniref:hypothetical protein n=1 Tax=Bacillus TaxID=1386 RepID=UPI00224992CB|nr:hypothetical protein [Bacillus sp. ChL18]MCX2809607.1 hypothetical protein [Bacillus sp. ChL18]